MERKMIIHATIDCAEDEIIGAKEAVTEALELMGCDVTRIDVEEVEEC